MKNIALLLEDGYSYRKLILKYLYSLPKTVIVWSIEPYLMSTLVKQVCKEAGYKYKGMRPKNLTKLKTISEIRFAYNERDRKLVNLVDEIALFLRDNFVNLPRFDNILIKARNLKVPIHHFQSYTEFYE